MGKKYLDTKGGTLESSVLEVWKQAAEVIETNKNDKSDDGEGLDAVQKDAVKKKFKDRKDKDIDNDGDTDDSDEYLHKKRKAISKAIGENGLYAARQLKDPKKEMMVVKNKNVQVIDKKDWKKYEKNGYTQAEEIDYPTAANFKIQSMKAALASIWGVEEGHNPFAKKDDDDEDKVKGAKKKTDTGKKAAKVDLNPEIEEKKKPLKAMYGKY